MDWIAFLTKEQAEREKVRDEGDYVSCRNMEVVLNTRRPPDRKPSIIRTEEMKTEIDSGL